MKNLREPNKAWRMQKEPVWNWRRTHDSLQKRRPKETMQSLIETSEKQYAHMLVVVTLIVVKIRKPT